MSATERPPGSPRGRSRSVLPRSPLWMPTMVLCLVAVGYAWLMGGSRPFTLAADTETAVAFVVVLAGGALAGRHSQLSRRPVSAAGTPPVGRSAQPAGPPVGRSAQPAGPPVGRSAQPGARTEAEAAPAAARTGPRRIWIWVAVLGAAGAWELFCYFSGFGGHRHAYPTISSLQDLASRWRAGRAAIVLLWIALGWRLLRR